MQLIKGNYVIVESGEYAGTKGQIKDIFIKSNIMDITAPERGNYDIKNLKEYAEIETESSNIIIETKYLKLSELMYEIIIIDWLKDNIEKWTDRAKIYYKNYQYDNNNENIKQYLQYSLQQRSSFKRLLKEHIAVNNC